MQRGDYYFAKNCLLWNSLKSVTKSTNHKFCMAIPEEWPNYLDIQIENRAFVM